MEKYIPLEPLLKEIERLYKLYDSVNDYPRMGVCVSLLSFINAANVKDVDLDFTKEADTWIKDNEDTSGFFDVQKFAEYFFKLGMATNNKVNEEDV